MGLVKLAAAGAAGYAFYRYATRNSEDRHAAFASGEAGDSNFAQVRNAGPSAMRDKPDGWTPTDEASDASFPASDPPSTY